MCETSARPVRLPGGIDLMPGVNFTSGLQRHARRPRPDRGQAGFTILEILVVITIIGLLIGLVAPAALRQLSGARNSVAKQSIERLGTVLDLYSLDMGSYPTTEQGLAALVKKPSGSTRWNGPYLKGDDVPQDPWSRPYVYRRPSERQGKDYDLCSTGPNGDASGADMICNQ
jgi:general secretion pathway protein G